MFYKIYFLLGSFFILLLCCSNPKQRENAVRISNQREENKDTVSFVMANSGLPDTARKQVVIPFDNKEGVPFHAFIMGDRDTSEYDYEYEYAMSGFEIDEKGRFYFMEGVDTAILAIFEDKKQVMRRNYTDFISSPLHLIKNKLVLFDKYYDRNNLFHLDPTNGDILAHFEKITEDYAHYFHFQDSILTLAVSNDGRFNINDEIIYLQYNLRGVFQDTANRLYPGLDVWPNDSGSHSYEFLGYWKQYLVFLSPESSSQDRVIISSWYRFVLVNEKGEVLREKNIDRKYTGELLFGSTLAPQEHRKLRNEKIYIFSRKDSNAVITILPLAGLFLDI